MLRIVDSAKQSNMAVTSLTLLSNVG